MPQGADIGLAAASPQNNLEHCQVIQKFQVPKMEVLNLIRQISDTIVFLAARQALSLSYT